MTRVLLAACLVLASLAAEARAAASPWFGTWKLRLKTVDEKPETLIYSDAGSGAMRMASIEDRSVIVTRFDGRPAPDVGATSGKGQALAIRATSPTSYSWTFSVAGTPRARGINTLAADGRSFTEVSWSIARPDRTIALVYDRQ